MHLESPLEEKGVKSAKRIRLQVQAKFSVKLYEIKS